MNTKNCPFCGKEISDEAIICKHCHRLLIDENGKDILPGAAEDTIPAAGQSAPEEPQEDKTRVFSKDELLRAMNEPEEAAEQEQYEAPGEEDPSAVGEDYYYENEPDAGYPAEEEYYEDNAYTEGYYDENDPNGAPAPLSDEEFFREFGMRKSDMRQPASDEYDPKRTFAVTAIITFGILVVVVGAVIVGSKLFDMKYTGIEATIEAISTSINCFVGNISVTFFEDSLAISTKNTMHLAILHDSEAMAMKTGESKSFTQINSKAIKIKVKYIVTLEYSLVLPIAISNGANGTI